MKNNFKTIFYATKKKKKKKSDIMEDFGKCDSKTLFFRNISVFNFDKVFMVGCQVHIYIWRGIQNSSFKNLSILNDSTIGICWRVCCKLWSFKGGKNKKR